VTLVEASTQLRNEIVFYTEGSGLIAPYPNLDHKFRTCDNGVMFFSEYHIMLEKLGLSTIGDKADYERIITTCMVSSCDGLVSRSPGDRGDEAPDDYYGLFAACVTLGLVGLGNRILDWGVKHCGSYNTNTPTKWTTDSWLFRQPQLAAAAYCASGNIPFYTRPLLWYAAAVIATSCINAPADDADSRRLSWLLIQAVTPYSWLCRQATKLWMRRLYKIYPNGMKDVANIYYHPNSGEARTVHPFITWWVTE
jgi:hypothetical protein